MTTYQEYESSLYLGEPVELYHFTKGTEIWRYTSHDEAVEYEGHAYAPTNISRTAPELSQQRSSAGITVTLPRNHEIPNLFKVFVPQSTLWLKILRLHKKENNQISEARPFWQGLIQAVNWQGSEAKLACDPITQLLQRQGPRVTYQSTCNHMLYSKPCGVVSDDYKEIITVESVSEYNIQSSSFRKQPDDWYALGFLSRQNEDFRMITEHKGDTVTLLLPFDNLAVGSELWLHTGCDRTIKTCQEKFNNHINFGGFPYIPTKNPFATGIE
jgi:uncharacterized phage protein (TIGR02218 family)